MNDLAKKVDECIQKRGVKKTWIAEQLGISQQLLNKRLNKKNFTIEDANEILGTIGYKTDFDIIPIANVQKELRKKTTNWKCLDKSDMAYIGENTPKESINFPSGFTETAENRSNKKIYKKEKGKIYE